MDKPHITQAMIDAYDEYTHLTLDRRRFMERLTALAGSGAAAAAIAPLLAAGSASAETVASDDARLLAKEVVYGGGSGEMKGYLVRPKEMAAPLGGVAFVGEDVGVVGSADDLRTLATSVRERLAGQAAVVAIAGRADGKPAVIVATTPAARETGARAGALAKAAAAALGGGGGGKDDLAQGGGSDPSAIPAAIEAIARELRSA